MQFENSTPEQNHPQLHCEKCRELYIPLIDSLGLQNVFESQTDRERHPQGGEGVEISLNVLFGLDKPQAE